jgi:hypothetical protein
VGAGAGKQNGENAEVGTQGCGADEQDGEWKSGCMVWSGCAGLDAGECVQDTALGE